MERATFELNIGDQQLSATHWHSAIEAKATVIIVHGFGEHQGRYQYVCQKFNDANVDVFTYDLRGHGKSPGKRGHFPDYQCLLDDLAVMLKKAREKHPDTPIFLYGHSFGGNLVINFLLQRDTEELSGAIITSPWLRLAFDPPRWKLLLANIGKRVAPAMTEKNGLDATDLSSDAKIVEAYTKDPLVHDKISARAFSQIYDAGLWALEQTKKINIPVLLAHGEADKITSHSASQEFANLHGHQVSFKSWPSLKHETHNELSKEQVVMFNVNWILNQLG